MPIQLLDEKFSDWIKNKFGSISSHMEVAYPIDVIQLQLDKGERVFHLLFLSHSYNSLTIHVVLDSSPLKDS